MLNLQIGFEILQSDFRRLKYDRKAIRHRTNSFNLIVFIQQNYFQRNRVLCETILGIHIAEL